MEIESLVINSQIYRDDDSYWAYLEEAYPQFTKHADIGSWTLFDLRPLRPYQTKGEFKKLIDKEDLSSWINLIYRYDLLLIIGNGGDGTLKCTKVKY